MLYDDKQHKHILFDLVLFGVCYILVYLYRSNRAGVENKSWVYDPHLFFRRSLMLSNGTLCRLNITKRKKNMSYYDVKKLMEIPYVTYINEVSRNIVNFSDYNLRYGYEYYKRIFDLIKSYDVRFVDENTNVSKNLIGFPPFKIELKKQDNDQILYFSLLIDIQEFDGNKRTPIYTTIV